MVNTKSLNGQNKRRGPVTCARVSVFPVFPYLRGAHTCLAPTRPRRSPLFPIFPESSVSILTPSYRSLPIRSFRFL